MGHSRSKTGWIALLALLVHVAAPLLAVARPGAPVDCLRGPEVHQCACRLDPHSLEECCCREARDPAACQLSSAPCSPEQKVAAPPSWTLTHLRPSAVAVLYVPRPGRDRHHSACRLEPLAGFALPPTPPPQTLSLA